MPKAKPVYWCEMRGLRGCYMPDESSTRAARTFEQFAASIRDEVRTHDLAWDLDYSEHENDDSEIAAEHLPDADSNDPRVLALLAEAWDHVRKPGYLGLCVAIGASNWDLDSVTLESGYGLTVHNATRGEYAEHVRAIRNA